MTALITALLATLLLAQIAQAPAPRGAAYTLAPGSTLTIQGDSNLHAWSCEARKLDATLYADPATPLLAHGLFLTVPISAIDCGNGTMNDKLRDALHQGQHPAIFFKLGAVEKGAGAALRVSGELTINAHKRAVAFTATSAVLEGGVVQAKGSVPLKMSDFGVDPPGMFILHTKDDLTIAFDLRAARRPATHASQP